ncbi:FtsX-like permease family protein [Streptomyces sp. NPDC000927]|uniref:FtsX-like permease family protein n=1 Tax=Streptomyces sp. NPDC000927 TaxID=3154371 RepID=UPI003329FAAB
MAMTVLISVLGIVNTLAMSVFERASEIGMLRAIGLDQHGTKRMVRLETESPRQAPSINQPATREPRGRLPPRISGEPRVAWARTWPRCFGCDDETSLIIDCWTFEASSVSWVWRSPGAVVGFSLVLEARDAWHGASPRRRDRPRTPRTAKTQAMSTKARLRARTPTDGSGRGRPPLPGCTACQLLPADRAWKVWMYCHFFDSCMCGVLAPGMNGESRAVRGGGAGAHCCAYGVSRARCSCCSWRWWGSWSSQHWGRWCSRPGARARRRPAARCLPPARRSPTLRGS